ncbi:MAG: hypothetical protein KGH57_00870 [Candidatus Micrarchaeota archaeon]|nr:hypothetical protein [Candidatus Micrarchaeota archaeon]
MPLELIKQFDLPNQETVYVYQGKKSDKDIVIKYRDKFTPERSKGRQLSHTVWTVAILMKLQGNKALTRKYVAYLLKIYDEIKGFESKEQQLKCELKYAGKSDLKEFEELNKYGQFSIELLTYIMELLSIEEKTDTKAGREVYMFRNLLQQLSEKDDIYSIIGASRYAGKK